MTPQAQSDFARFSFGTQVRKSPFSDAALRWGAMGFSVYNHMYIPRDFGAPVQNFWNLVNDAILCDVGVEDAEHRVEVQEFADLHPSALPSAASFLLRIWRTLMPVSSAPSVTSR